jgi:hypothetical protein
MGQISSSMTKGRIFFLKGENYFRGSNLFTFICFLYAFNIFLFGG